MAHRDANGGVFGCRFRAVLVGPHGHGGLSGIWVLEGGGGPPRPEATLNFMLRSVFGGDAPFSMSQQPSAGFAWAEFV